MPAITHVKKAQQRYVVVPVIDPATGEQKQTPVTNGDGQPRLTKTGRPVLMPISTPDKSRPLPPRRCDHCGEDIEVGTSFKHISPRSGPYGGRTLYRHEDCPTWNVWEYSSSLSARLAQVAHDFGDTLDTAESEDDVQSALDDAATAVREIAEEKRESASNIEDGFGHATYQSDELNQQADDLDSWADEIESATIPDFPEVEEDVCDECGEPVEEWTSADGTETGWRHEVRLAADNDDEYDHEAERREEPDELEVAAWRDECRGDLTVVDEPPV